MNDAVILLAEQVETAGERVEGATGAVREALAALDASYEEWATLQKALAIVTRGSEAPFVPALPPHPLEAILAELQRRGAKAEKAEQASNGKREKAPPPPPTPTKIGVIWEAILGLDVHVFGTDDILKAIPPDAPLKITRDDIQRNLPKLLNRAQIWRVGRDRYRLNEPLAGRPSEHDFALIKNDEEQSERMPLAG